MKVVLYMAMSLNGYITGEDHTEDFLSVENWDTLLELLKDHKCMIWGSNTYKIVQTWDKKYINSLNDATKIIISKDPNLIVSDGFIKANSPENALRILKDKGFNSVILTGGSGINTSFAKENLIDEVIINIEPVIVGSGIPLFKKSELTLNLELMESKNLYGKLLQLNYRVKK
jgi:dihydrofolate reductase